MIAGSALYISVFYNKGITAPATYVEKKTSTYTQIIGKWMLHLTLALLILV
jgi:hypothetical protein